MRKVREVLRLRLGAGLSIRQVADSCKVSVGTVSEYEKRARAAGLDWPLPTDLDDAGLERMVRAGEGEFRHNRPLPDASYLISEMKQRLMLPFTFCGWGNENLCPVVTATPSSATTTTRLRPKRTWCFGRSTELARSCLPTTPATRSRWSTPRLER